MHVEAQEVSRARFGDFELELRTGELRRSGTRIRLSPQPLKVLILLLERSGQLVTREEVRREVWGSETFVDFEHGLNFAIKRIRDVLGDEADAPRYIETLPRRGYRFITPVEWLDSAGSQPAGPDAEAPTNNRSNSGQVDSAVDGVKPAAKLLRDHARWLWILTATCLLASGGFSVLTLDGIRERLGAVLHLPVSAGARSPKISSIAVLPLESLSSDSQQEYFADGLTDSLITDLGQVGTLRVISRASVIQYKRGKTPLPQIARDLNVDAVVEGTVLRAGNRVRISVQLLDARADRHLWAQIYERDLEDVINVERQAALAIAHEISGRLTTAQEMRLKSPESVKPEAFDAYLRGSYLLAERSPEAETGARGYFERAVREDPGFAPAYGGLALYYSVACGTVSDFPVAEEYARKAVALDPNLAEGHTALGYVRLVQHDYPAAKSEFEKAISLNPNYALAYDLYADYWLYMGHPTEALAENSKALELDPFSYAYNYLQSGILYYLGQYGAALEKAQTVAALNPQVAGIEQWTVQLEWAAGRAPEALADQRKIGLATRSPQVERDAQQVARIYSSAGLRAAIAREVSVRVQRRTQSLRSGNRLSELESAGSIAILYSLLGDRENTLRWLNEALREDRGHLHEDLMCTRSFDFLRSDARFKAIERRLGLPPESELSNPTVDAIANAGSSSLRSSE
jgi:TolB-like protein/DNA-binding winged helix-turn-helix (wHTH) protein